MKKMIKLILVLAVAGCGTAPKVHNFERFRSLQVSKDEAWLGVIDFFTSNSLQIKTIEKDSGIIYAESGSLIVDLPTVATPAWQSPFRTPANSTFLSASRDTVPKWSSILSIGK